jgi:hypothetical protein
MFTRMFRYVFPLRCGDYIFHCWHAIGMTSIPRSGKCKKADVSAYLYQCCRCDATKPVPRTRGINGD